MTLIIHLLTSAIFRCLSSQLLQKPRASLTLPRASGTFRVNSNYSLNLFPFAVPSNFISINLSIYACSLIFSQPINPIRTNSLLCIITLTWLCYRLCLSWLPLPCIPASSLMIMSLIRQDHFLYFSRIGRIWSAPT